MKTQDLSTIMKMAWRFARITGETFSQCLKQAWANFKLKHHMQSSIVKFYFRKVDGTLREAYGTLSYKIIPKTVQQNNRKVNDTVQIYFDTECQEWRCYKMLNLVK